MTADLRKLKGFEISKEVVEWMAESNDQTEDEQWEAEKGEKLRRKRS